MPMNLNLTLPNTAPSKTYRTLNSWKRGVITLIDKSLIPTDALIEAQNIILTEDGTPTVRPGTDWYGNAPTSYAIDGASEYEYQSGTSDPVPHLVIVSNGTVYRSTDDGTTWTACTGFTLTAGKKCFFVQDHGYLYITNKTDIIVRYDGTTTLSSYTVLATPSAPTATVTGMAGSTYNHYYKISAVNDVGFTIGSSPSTVKTTSIDRTSWSYTAANYMNLSWTAVVGALRYDIYYSNDNINFYYLDTTVGNASVGYLDDGSAVQNTNVLSPIDNTTQGPIIQRLEQIGSRLWGVEDLDNQWRVWFSGAGNYSGYFSSAYEGGYIDLMKGSQFRPVRVVDYRDGKGTPYATVWMKSQDGRGCIWQITLESITVGSNTVTTPSAYKLPGSRGTDAPESVVNVLNDYIFYNTQAFYNIGSRAQFANLLSTDESSANIRPSVKKISSAYASGIASIYYEAKVYWSVPIGSSTNNYTIVYDTERKAWIPEAFTIGFERFFQYTDTIGARKLLAWKTGDTKLTQISSSITGDYSQAFISSLVTGLYPVSKNRFDFMRVMEGEIELSQQSGRVNIELLDISRTGGYSTIKTQSITSASSTTGWSTRFWSKYLWSDSSDALSTFSESSIKRYFTIRKDLNAYQWHISTTSKGSNYLLRTLQLNGRATNTGKPRQWRIV